jgi:hypothetical protein
MNEDYLWDRSGPPDPTVEHLERALAPLRYRHRMPQPKPRRVWVPIAAVAAMAAAAALLVTTVPIARPTGWQVSGAMLHAGQLLRTGAAQVTLQSDDVGKLDLGPNSALRASSGRKVMLERGTLHAFIWAPPREFVVDTPSSRAVDLGCEYTLQVDTAGNGLLQVQMGWVAFQHDDAEAFIPAGAQCVTSRRRGPGIPFYPDAPAPLRASLTAWESGDAAALPAILEAARPRDALTLWHLLTRVPVAERGAVYDRFAELVTLPAQATRDAILHRDAHALDLCWNALGLENTGWWRGWERRWQ